MTNLDATFHTRRLGAAIAFVIAVIAAGAVALLWAWNTLAVDLFAAPAIGFRHVIAAELAVTVVVGLSSAVAGVGGNRNGATR